MRDPVHGAPGRWHEPYPSSDRMWRVELNYRLTSWEEEAGLLRVLVAPSEAELAEMQVRQDALAATVAAPVPGGRGGCRGWEG